MGDTNRDPKRSVDGQHDFTIGLLLQAASRQQQQQQPQQQPQPANLFPQREPQMPQLQQNFTPQPQQLGAAYSQSNIWPSFLPSTASCPSSASAVSSVATPSISTLQNQQVKIPYNDLLKLLQLTINGNASGNGGNTTDYQMGSPPQAPANMQLMNGRSSNDDAIGSGVVTSSRPRAPDHLPKARASGTRTFPCRARGMPETHNFNTAVLTVTKDTKHGGGLICSHPTCRDGGIKFAYCLHCQRPVSKRLFRGKHKYCTAEDNEANNKAKKSPPVPESAGQDHARVSSSGTTTEGTPSAEPSHESNMGHDDEGDDDYVDDGDNHDDDDAKPPASPVGKKCKAQDEREDGDGDNSLVQAYICKAYDDNTTMEPWTRLLLIRPSTNDESQMAAWLQAVLQISQTEKAKVVSRLQAKIDR